MVQLRQALPGLNSLIMQTCGLQVTQLRLQHSRLQCSRVLRVSPCTVCSVVSVQLALQIVCHLCTETERADGTSNNGVVAALGRASSQQPRMLPLLQHVQHMPTWPLLLHPTWTPKDCAASWVLSHVLTYRIGYLFIFSKAEGRLANVSARNADPQPSHPGCWPMGSFQRLRLGPDVHWYIYRAVIPLAAHSLTQKPHSTCCPPSGQLCSAV
jgi:hypothetical protein